MKSKLMSLMLHTTGSGIAICDARAGSARRDRWSSPQAVIGECVQAEQIRLLGSRDNVELIDTLYRTENMPPIMLCTPMVSGKSLAATFANMEEWHVSPSLGGFHALSSRDAPSYALAAALETTGGRLGVTTRELLHTHRAWPALSFLSSIDETSAARFVSDVLDPRWFIDLKKPNSTDRLHHYLGLSKLHVANAVTGRAPTTKQAARCANVLACWYQTIAANRLDEPGAFLQRVVAAGTPDHNLAGVVRGCRLFVEFVCDAWLDLLTPQEIELFVPEHFFSEPATAASFRNHLQRFASWR